MEGPQLRTYRNKQAQNIKGPKNNNMIYTPEDTVYFVPKTWNNLPNTLG